jgi:hypothetical protein
MTAVTVDARIPARAGSARSPFAVLARYEAGRFVRHPVFLFTTAVMAYNTYRVFADSYPNRTVAGLELTLGPAWWVGLGGLLVAYRLTRSTRRADEAVAGVPADEPTRTAALLVACLVPFAVAVLYTVTVLVAWHVEPMAWTTGWDHWSAPERDAMLVAGALAGLGGPVLGVCLGRWWRWPGAPLLATVILVAWAILSTAPWDSRLGNVWHMTSPYVLWYSGTDSDAVNEALGGSPVWRLGYLLVLIALAAVTALLHGSDGARRVLLQRWFAGLGVLAVVLLLVAALSGHDFTVMPKT